MDTEGMGHLPELTQLRNDRGRVQTQAERPLRTQCQSLLLQGHMRQRPGSKDPSPLLGSWLQPAWGWGTSTGPLHPVLCGTTATEGKQAWGTGESALGPWEHVPIAA